MSDMYSRGLATGDWIGGMVRNASGASGREAYLQATKREKAMDDIANQGGYVEYDNQLGQWRLTQQGQSFYAGHPHFAQKAMIMAPQRAMEAHEKAIKIGQDSVQLLAKINDENDKRIEKAKKMYSRDPEKLAEIVGAIEQTSYDAAMKYLPDIFRQPVTEAFVQSMKGLTLRQREEAIFENTILSYVQKMSKPGFIPDAREITPLEIAFSGLSDDGQARFQATMEKIRVMKTGQQIAVEANANEMKAQMQAPGDLARRGAQERQAAGIQEAKEKRVVDYRASKEKPIKYQLVGNAADTGEPVSYNSTTGGYEVNGQPYTGKVTPRTSNPEVVGREAGKLRQEFNKLPEVKQFKEIKFRGDVMTEAMKEAEKTNNFVAVDQALITTFNKMTDPDSVVRESEYARTASDLALINRLKGKVQKMGTGGAGLTQSDRQALYVMAKRFNEVAEKKYKAALHEYRGYIANYGVDPETYLKPAVAERTVVETRITNDGRKLVKYSDGTIEEQK